MNGSAAVAGIAIRPPEVAGAPWLRNPRWDLVFVIGSALIALVPYSIYIVLGGHALEEANQKGTTAYNARVTVNLLVALLVGGPHMYATFTRTLMNPEFVRKRAGFIATSLLIPVVVFVSAVYTYESYVWLLSVFFAMASVHALHQLVWISEAYNQRARSGDNWLCRAIDYGVVFASLYPIAIWKMVENRFEIGPVRLKYNEYLAGQYWFAGLVMGFFIVMLAAFVVKTFVEHRQGRFNLPKTLLIALTALLMFWTPAFPNMDTAFQGVNVWHSFQYLALTWHANKLREQRTGVRFEYLHLWEDLWRKVRAALTRTESGWKHRVEEGVLAVVNRLRQVDRDTGWSTFYLLCIGMLPISGLLIVLAGTFWPHAHGNLPGSDEAYTYMGILSVLLVHYVHDAVLFTDHEAILEAAPQPASAPA
jgi:hypothetical protein